MMINIIYVFISNEYKNYLSKHETDIYDDCNARDFHDGICKER